MPNPFAQQLRYGSDLHDKVRDRVLAREKVSAQAMQKRHAKWDRAEEDFKAYAPAATEDTRRRAQRSKGQHEYTTIIVPYSYASLLAAHTYQCSVFFSRTPVHQYSARHGQGAMGSSAMEAIIDYQVSVGGQMVPYYIWPLDAGKYGIGILGSYWADERTVVARIEDVPVIDEATGLPIEGRMRTEIIREEIQGYKGNRVFNVRPYDWRPDPRVALVNFQAGEFCGRLTHEGWSAVLKNRDYFNVEVLKEQTKGYESMEHDNVGSGQVQLPEVNTPVQTRLAGDERGSISILEMVVEIVPSEWHLDDTDYPEKWFFKIANNRVIIQAEPFGHIHDKYPFDALFNEVDGYGMDQRGLLEIAQPINDAMTWAINSHFYNVRKALNDQVIYDPSRIHMKDATEGGPGRIIRVRPAGYGQDVHSMYAQIPVIDITGSHLKDTQLLGDLMQRITGVNDNIMGSVNPGGRKTATEIRTSSTFGINRLKTQAEYFSSTGFAPLSQKLVQNTQQFYDGDQMFKVAGSSAINMQYLRVTPDSILGFFDFVPVDGTLPIDRFAQAALWKDVLMTAMQVPQLAQAYDIAGIFAWVSSQLLGLKNIDQFKVQMMPQQQIQSQMQQGNIIPIGGTGGRTRPTGTPSVPTSGPGIIAQR